MDCPTYSRQQTEIHSPRRLAPSGTPPVRCQPWRKLPTEGVVAVVGRRACYRGIFEYLIYNLMIKLTFLNFEIRRPVLISGVQWPLRSVQFSGVCLLLQVFERLWQSSATHDLLHPPFTFSNIVIVRSGAACEATLPPACALLSRGCVWRHDRSHAVVCAQGVLTPPMHKKMVGCGGPPISPVGAAGGFRFFWPFSGAGCPEKDSPLVAIKTPSKPR